MVSSYSYLPAAREDPSQMLGMTLKGRHSAATFALSRAVSASSTVPSAVSATP
jgi:hypothetical protein